MGNWNRRWLPRKKYNYEAFPPSPPPRYAQSHSPAVQESSVPSWERDFCKAAGIPWHRVVTAKRYMYCYDNVVKWDDSAGQEAFNDAKRRYWAKISGVPPQNPPPNPDMYIDKVDWDCTVDPELILDLDREYFNPNEAERSVKSESNLVSGCTLIWEDKTADNGENPWGSCNALGSKTGENAWESGNAQGSKTGENPWESCNVQGSKAGENPWESGNAQGSKTGENPWESGNVQGSKTFEDVGQTWNEWDNPVNTNDNDPWEKSCPITQGTVKDTAWGSRANDSWGCVDNTFSDLWHQGGQGVGGTKGNGWDNNRTGSWGQNRWNSNREHEQWSSDYGSRCNRNFARGGGTTSKNRRWGEPESTSWGWQRSPRQSNERNRDFGRPCNRDDETFYSGSRKREGPSQHVSSYKSSRFQGDEQRAAYNWRETQKRVTFNFNG